MVAGMLGEYDVDTANVQAVGRVSDGFAHGVKDVALNGELASDTVVTGGIERDPHPKTGRAAVACAGAALFVKDPVSQVLAGLQAVPQADINRLAVGRGQ